MWDGDLRLSLLRLEVETEGAPPKGCGGLWCIVTGTRSSLLHRQGAAPRVGGKPLLRILEQKNVVSGWHANDRAVTRGLMDSSGDLIGERRLAASRVI